MDPKKSGIVLGGGGCCFSLPGRFKRLCGQLGSRAAQQSPCASTPLPGAPLTRTPCCCAGATAAFFVLQFARFNVIALTAYALMVAVLGCFIWNNVASFAHK